MKRDRRSGGYVPGNRVARNGHGAMIDGAFHRGKDPRRDPGLWALLNGMLDNSLVPLFFLIYTTGIVSWGYIPPLGYDW